MGAEVFATTAEGETAEKAFANAVKQAQHDFGHSGYSGSIAEKTSFTVIRLERLSKAAPEFPTVGQANTYADQLIEGGDKRVEDKWGPAGCIQLGPTLFLFFGLASS